ncbi:MAG: hypothetical protein ACUVWR_09190 [Anaerolineae bacterium]
MADMADVRLKVPQEWLRELQDEVTALEVVSLGVREYRIQKALTLYSRGVGSIGYVAELVGIPKLLLMEEGRRRGFVPGYDEKSAQEDIGQCQP